jgi:hypothetical protein
MNKPGIRYCIGIALWLTTALLGEAASFSEDFTVDPFQNSWSRFGDASLFNWNSANQNLEVTWDSSRTNSYFYRRLQTVLSKSDDFSLAFDLRLNDVAIGVNTNKPYTFELAIGFLNFRSATNVNFFRGAGIQATYGPRNLLEFDYFPDSGFGATVAPTIVSSNNGIRFSDNHPLELTSGDLFHVVMAYTGSNQVLRTAMTRNGTAFGLPPGNTIHDLSLAGFSDFRLDTVAVMSYSDGGQSPPQFSGSILGHGSVDNIIWTAPEPPFSNVRGHFKDEIWEVTFAGRSNWVYSLERTIDFKSWTAVGSYTTAQSALIILQDTSPGPHHFYRIRGERP